MTTGQNRLGLGSLSLVAALVALPTAALATHPVGSEDYSLVGISADGKHVYFERLDQSPGGEQQLWLRVVDSATGKVVKAVPIYRECDQDPSGLSPCEFGEPISKKQSAKYRSQLYAKFGQPTGGRSGSLVVKGNVGSATELISTATGFAQTWQIGKVRITTRLKSSAKLLPAFEYQGVAVTMGVLLEGPWGKCEGVGKFSVSPEAEGWSNEISWPSFSAKSLQLAPKGRAVAFVLGNRPIVIALKPIGSPKPASTPAASSK